MARHRLYNTRFFRNACLAISIAWIANSNATVVDSIRYPAGESASDSRYLYDWEVLRTALERTTARYGEFEMQPSAERMTAARVTHEMALQNGKINLFVRATSRELEQKLRPIRIPVDRGLLGYRIFLIRKVETARFAEIQDIKQLRPLRVGQGRGWADVGILASNGINVVEGANYEGLFDMLRMQRFDYFSRSTDEALREYDERREKIPELGIEPGLLLYYPLPRYFFVRRDQEGERLAQRIEAGLEMMVKNGSLQALFWKYKGDLIERANLARRRLIKIDNPLLPVETPLHRPELWYDPFQRK